MRRFRSGVAVKWSQQRRDLATLTSYCRGEQTSPPDSPLAALLFNLSLGKGSA